MKPHVLLFALFLAANSLAAEPENWAFMQRAVLFEQDSEKIKSLVASGVDPSAPIGCGSFAPLDGAIHRENPEMVALLLSLGAKPAQRQLVAAASSANHEAGLKIVKLLHAAGVSINARQYFSSKDDRFSTAIHRAVSRENAGLIAYLLDQEGIQVDLHNVDGDTPPMIAVENGSGEILDMLLAAGQTPR